VSGLVTSLPVAASRIRLAVARVGREARLVSASRCEAAVRLANEDLGISIENTGVRSGS
jgi:hypothetical protein